jgi:hypothetical protein
MIGCSSPGNPGIFLFTTASSPTLGPNQLPIQWVPGALSLGVKWPDRELTAHIHEMPRSRIRGAVPPLDYYASNVCAELKKSTRTTLPSPFLSHLLLGLQNDLFPKDFLAKTVYAFISHIRAVCLAHIIQLDLIVLITAQLGESTNYRRRHYAVFFILPPFSVS